MGILRRRPKDAPARPDRSAEFASYTVSASRGRMASDLSTGAAAVAKESPVRSEAYRRYVAALPCWYCGLQGYTQAAHADMGKGMALKTDDRTCFPLCGPNGRRLGCHATIGSTGTMPRKMRRTTEQRAGRETQQVLIRMSAVDPVLQALLLKIGVPSD